MFEMSDDESISSRHSAAVAGGGSNEHLASKTSTDHQKMSNDRPSGQFYRSSRPPSVISESVESDGVNLGTVNHHELATGIRDQLRELRETKENPKYSLAKGGD